MNRHIIESVFISVREIVMNPLPSDANGDIVDIFVLSGSTGAPELKETLEQGGYQLTPFHSAEHLLETLHTGIPNLLIIDVTTDELDGYGICRQIKADDNLWMIPILLLSRTTGLTDLLSVLDCNADNFVAYPCDPQFLLAFIDGMLGTPVERQTPEMVKTQFRIQHDDKVYLVTADRRKLLELLLSSFEIAVSINSELLQTREEVHELTGDTAGHKDTIIDLNRTLGRVSESLQQKELAEKRLARDLAAKDAEIALRAGEITRLQKDIDDDRSLIASAEEHIRAMMQEKDEIESAHLAATTSLQQQIADLTSGFDMKKAEGETLRRDLEQNVTRLRETEARLQDLVPKNEETERFLQAITIETGRIKESLEASKTHVLSLEDRIIALQEEKDRAEQDLSAQIARLGDAAKQKEEELARVRTELDAGILREASAADELTGLAREKERAESELRVESDTLKQQIANLVEKLGASTGRLEETEGRRAAADAELADAAAERERLNAQIATVSSERDAMRGSVENNGQKIIALEQRIGSLAADSRKYEEGYRTATEALETAQAALDGERARSDTLDDERNAAIRGKEESAAIFRQQIDAVRQELESRTAELHQVRELFDTSSTRLRTIEDELAMVSQAGKASWEEARTRSGELEQARLELVAERERRAADREELGKVSVDLDGLGEKLASEREMRLNAEEAVRSLRVRLETTVAEQRATEQRFRESEAEFSEKFREITAELHESGDAKKALEAAEETHEADSEELRKILAERDQLSEALASERKLRTGADASLASLRTERERFSAERAAADLHFREHEEKYSARIEEVAKELRASEDARKGLEKQLEFMIAEKTAAEQNANSLAREIEQARSALAEEWESHMTADERLAATEERSEQLLAAEQKLKDLDTELQQARSALADEWESHMNAKEKLAAAEGEKHGTESSRQETLPQTQVGFSTAGALPVVIEPRPKAIARVEIPAIHPVHPAEEREKPYEDGEDKGEIPATVPPSYAVSAADVSIDDLFEDEDPVKKQDLLFPANPEDARKDENPDGREVTDDSPEEDEPEEDAADEDGEETGNEPGSPVPPDAMPPGGFAFNRQQWFELFTWARHADGITTDQRSQIMRMGRLVQQGRRLTQKQEAGIREMIELVHSLGYRFP